MESFDSHGFPAEPLPELSDGLWQRLEWLIAATDPQLNSASARAIVKALLYRQLTGSSWTQVAEPQAGQVEAAYRRWRASGLLEQLGEVLQLRLDDE